MADIAHNKIMRGRPVQLTIQTSAPASVLDLENIKDGLVSINEEIKEDAYEVEDGTEILNAYARKVIVEFTYSEVDTTDIAAVDGLVSAEVNLVTATGGANATGQTFDMAACDDIKAFIEDTKTKIVCTKTTNDRATLPYTITDNAA